MPSLDTIRTVRIQGQTDGVDQATAALNKLTASIAAANDNLSKSNAAAQSGADGWTVTSAGALTAANHMRQAAEAAYVFSPAFRGVVNEMAAPALAGASTALEAVAAGLVKSTNVAGTGLIYLSGAVEKVAPGFVGLTTSVKSAGAAMEAFAPTIGGVAGSVLGLAGTFVSRFLPIVGQITLVYDAFKLVGDVIDATKNRLAEMIDVANKSQDLGLSAEFFQTFISGAKGAQDQIVSFQAALATAFQATKPVLNPDWSVWDVGVTKVSAVAKAISDTKQLFTTDQNFSGATAFNAATDQGDKIKAALTYMIQLRDVGQEVAGLDIGEKLFGSQFVDNIRTGKTSLDEMLKTLQDGSKTTFISDENAKNAKDLNDRLNDAYFALNEKFKPSVDDIAAISLKIKGYWVDIVEAIANTKIPSNFNEAPDIAYVRSLQKAGPGGDESAGLNTAARSVGNGFPGNVVPFPTRRPQDAPAPPPTYDTTDSVDRAINSLRKHTDQQIADTKAVGLGDAALASFRAQASETAAVQANHGKETAAQADSFAKLRDQAAAAADALAKAKVASQIDFSSKTAFLSSDDVQIAQQLKGIYGNDVPAALSSTYASAIRVNNAFHELSSTIESDLTSGLTDIVSGTTSVSQGFANMANSIVKSIEQMIIKLTIVQPLMQALQSSAGASGLLSFLGGGGGGAAAQAASASTLTNNTGGAFFGPGFAAGGYTGSGGRLEIAGAVHKGEYVIDADNTSRIGVANLDRMRGYANGGYVGSPPANSNSRAPNITVINNSGAQSQTTTAPNGDVTILIDKKIDAAVGKSMSTGTGMRVLGSQYGVKQFTGQ